MSDENIFDRELSLLEEVIAVLEAESAALDRLDHQSIDLAAEAKLELDLRLSATAAERVASGLRCDDNRRAAYSEKMTRLRALALENERRLRIAGKTVEGLVRALTGAPTPGYGPRRGAALPARPVLTSTLG